MAKAKSRAHKSLCVSNCKQWGISVSMYAADSDNSFPDNSQGYHLSWTTDFNGKKVFTSVHRVQAGAPEGGNFLFEDGHVEWFGGKKVGLGATVGSWMCYFRVPVAE